MRTLRISTLNFHIQYSAVLIIFIMLYIMNLVLTYTVTRNLYFLATFIRFLLPQFPHLPSLVITIWSLFLWVCLFVLNYNTMLVPGEQWFDISIWYFYTFQNDHHTWLRVLTSNYHLSPYRNSTLLLIIFFSLYILSLILSWRVLYGTVRTPGTTKMPVHFKESMTHAFYHLNMDLKIYSFLQHFRKEEKPTQNILKSPFNYFKCL